MLKTEHSSQRDSNLLRLGGGTRDLKGNGRKVNGKPSRDRQQQDQI